MEEWNLPLNTEELQELAYATLCHFDSASSWEEIHVNVRKQIADYRERNQLR